MNDEKLQRLCHGRESRKIDWFVNVAFLIPPKEALA